MYTTCKNILRNLVPKSFLQKNEFFFRSIAAIPYTGNSVQCNICGKKLQRFELNNNDLLCPACGSLSRTRQLWDYLNANHLLHGDVLHFSPSSILNKKLSNHQFITYTSTDFENEFLASENYDITDLPLKDESFDLIICFHVLEHIKDDKKAMSELFRVLKSNGTILIQTPFKDGDIYEDDAVTTEHARLIAFGQEDHVRIYSKAGLLQRFQECNRKAILKIVSLKEDPFFGMTENALIQISKS